MPPLPTIRTFVPPPPCRALKLPRTHPYARHAEFFSWEDAEAKLLRGKLVTKKKWLHSYAFYSHGKFWLTSHYCTVYPYAPANGNAKNWRRNFLPGLWREIMPLEIELGAKLPKIEIRERNWQPYGKAPRIDNSNIEEWLALEGNL